MVENMNTVNTTNINQMNNTFNLNVFLNETCKDAMDIKEFVNSIQLDLSDLEQLGDKGYIDGVTNIFTTRLNALDIRKRPIHCTDKKRDTIYVKDAGKWEKEDETYPRLKTAVKDISNRNIHMLAKYRDKYPDYKDASSPRSDVYSMIVIETMGGNKYGDDTNAKELKIIRNIAKHVSIKKN